MSVIDEADAATSPVGDGSRAPFSRWAFLWIWLGFTAVVLLEARGLIVRDTELGVDVAPLQWIASAVHLWDPSAYSGSVQIEKFGYLFPMAPFFGIGELLHVPVWITERIWLSSLLAIGAWGVIRVAEALGPSRRWARVLGGIVYVTIPIVVDWSILSVNILSVVFLPWVLLPLMKGSREGSPRRMAARSGVAVALMGGVNATVILASLPLAALWLVTRSAGRRRRALIGWWVISLGLACFWWFAGALLQGKYGYNYLPYTETSVNTTSTASLFESIRGTSNWLNYFHQGGKATEGGGYTLISSWVAILGTSIVAGLGLAGLSLKRVPERIFLVAGVAFGTLVMASGYRGAGGGLFSPVVLSILTQPLAFLRNISKFSPDVAFPLALGLIWLLSSIDEVARRHDGAPRGAPRFLRVAVIILALGGTVAAGFPILKNQLYGPGGFSAIPSYWNQAATWLDTHQGRQTTLLVPGSPFGTYRWGNPQDEPLSVLTGTSLTARTIVPFGSDGNTQMLSVVENIIDSGTPNPGLAGYLSRSGIDYLVERNNLDRQVTSAPQPAQVHQVLSQTPGLVRVASFGPYVPRASTENGTLPVYDTGRPARMRALEIYMVVPKAKELRTFPASSPVIVSGSPSSLVALGAAGALNGRAVILAKDAASRQASQRPNSSWALTDGNQRRVLKFGKVHDNSSYLLGAGQVLRGGNSVEAFSFGYGNLGPPKSQTTSSPIGAAQLGFSMGARTFAVGTFVPPSLGPSSAFDGNPLTAWIPNVGPTVTHQSVGIRLTHPVFVSKIALVPLDDRVQRSKILRVKITTSAGSVTSSLPAGPGPIWLPTRPGMTSRIWVTIVAVKPGVGVKGSLVGPGIVQITIPGVTYRPGMALPTDELSTFSASGRLDPIVSFDDPVRNLNLDFYAAERTPAPWARKLTLPHATTMTITGTAVANPGVDLDKLVKASTAPPGASLRVVASSTLRNLPIFRAANLTEATPQPWIAALGDQHPTLHLSWTGERSVDSIDVGTTAEASRPRTLLVQAGVTHQVVNVPALGGIIHLDPVTTDHLDVTVLSSVPRFTMLPAGSARVEGSFEYPSPVPPGLRSLTIPALGPTISQPVRASATLTAACGTGPEIDVGATAVQTRIEGTVGALTSLSPVRYEACSSVKFQAGRTTISFPGRGAFRITALSGLPEHHVGTSSLGHAREARIDSWGATTRKVELSRGPATYLQVSQNANPGWVATMGGETLTPVTLEGWQQAWFVPAGAAGTVTMTFAPDKTFQLVLFVGLLFLLLLAALALFARRGEDAAALTARRPYPTWLLVALTVIVVVGVSIYGVILFIPLLLLAWWRRRTNMMAWVTGGAFVTAGLYVAHRPETDFLRSFGSFSLAAQLLAAVSLIALMCQAIAMERTRASTAEERADSAVNSDSSV